MAGWANKETEHIATVKIAQATQLTPVGERKLSDKQPSRPADL